MLCMRCGGLFVIDDFIDLQQGRSEMRAQGYRCVNCGCIEDPTVRANRHHARSTKHLGPSELGRNGLVGSRESIRSDDDVGERGCHALDCEN